VPPFPDSLDNRPRQACLRDDVHPNRHLPQGGGRVHRWKQSDVSASTCGLSDRQCCSEGQMCLNSQQGSEILTGSTIADTRDKPILIAAAEGSLEMVKLLVRHKAVSRRVS